MSDKKQELAAQAPAKRARLMPAVDIFEDESGLTLLADLPGVPKDGLNVRVDGDTLSIEGEMRLDLPESMEADYAEVGAGGFHRSFTLSRDLDAAKAESALDNGVLRLRIPKAEHAQRRKIEVKVG